MRLLLFLNLLAVVASQKQAKLPYPKNKERSTDYWRLDSSDYLSKQLGIKSRLARAKNAILFIGDGSGVVPNTAGRIYRSQRDNLESDQTPLVWENFPHVGLAKTYCLDNHVTDSAAAATALLSGVKARFHSLGLAPHTDDWLDCASNDRFPVTSVAQWAHDAGKRIGLVTTKAVTDATPAALYGHSIFRDVQAAGDIDAFPRLKQPHLCKDLALQLVEDSPGKHLRVILGGGRDRFLPNTTEDSEEKGKFGRRTDARNLMDHWTSMNGRRKVVTSKDQLEKVDYARTDYLMGLFDYDHNEYQLQHDADKRTDNPSLPEMAAAAVRMLNGSSSGFFLLVESGRIDDALHDNLGQLFLGEHYMFHKTVELLAEMVDLDDTLMVVTADHSHSVTIPGYPPRSVSILGKHEGAVWGMSDEMPLTALQFANGPSAAHHHPGTAARRNLTNIDTEALDFEQPAFMPALMDTHGGEDVAVYAVGPFSQLFAGVVENTFIPHAIAFALCIGPATADCSNWSNGYDAAGQNTSTGKRIVDGIYSESKTTVESSRVTLYWVLIIICGLNLLLLVILTSLVWKNRKNGGYKVNSELPSLFTLTSSTAP